MACPHYCTCRKSRQNKAIFLEDKERDLRQMHAFLDQKLMHCSNNTPDLNAVNKLNCALKKLEGVVNQTEQLNEDIRVSKTFKSCADCEYKRQELFGEIQKILQRLQTCPGPCLCGEKVLGYWDEPKTRKRRFKECFMNFSRNIFRKLKNMIRRKKRIYIEYEPSSKKQKFRFKKYFSKYDVNDKPKKKIKEKKHHWKKSKSGDDVKEKFFKEPKVVKQRFKKYSSKNDINENTTPKTKGKKKCFLKKLLSKEKSEKKIKDRKRSPKETKVKPPKKIKDKKHSPKSEAEEVPPKVVSPTKKRKSIRKSLTKEVKNTKRRLKEFSESIDRQSGCYTYGPTGFCRDVIMGAPPLWIPMTKCNKVPNRMKCKQLLTCLGMLAALLFWSPCLLCIACCILCCCCHSNCR